MIVDLSFPTSEAGTENYQSFFLAHGVHRNGIVDKLGIFDGLVSINDKNKSRSTLRYELSNVFFNLVNIIEY